MSPEESTANIITFFESISRYYGCRTEITEGLYTGRDVFDANFTTWNLSEFVLMRSAYRNNGERFMLEGDKMYYEIAGAIIIDFKQPGRNSYEFVERYSDSVYRITKIKFHYRY